MNCPYQDSLVPRCTIVTHPDRANIEYCRVCGEWRQIDRIGDEFPNLFWLIVGVAIVLVIFSSMLNRAEQSIPPEPNQSQVQSNDQQFHSLTALH